MHGICVYQCHDRMSVCLCVSIYSLTGNSIGAEGAVAISEAINTMTNLQELK